MMIYHVHPRTGELLGNGTADKNPLEPGKWLIPAHACAVAPPECPAGRVAVWANEAWSLVIDMRGPVFSTETGAQSRHEDLGELPAGLTQLAPPSTDHRWDAGAWVLDDAAKATRASQAERAWRNNELDSVKWLRERHRDERENEQDTTLSAVQFSELMAYIQQLRDWPQSDQFPEANHRPAPPEWIDTKSQ